MKRFVKHKFHARPSEYNGIHFASQLEKKWYINLKLLQQAGEVLFFLRQIPFHLTGNIVYRADFMVFFTDEHVEIWEIKGFETDSWKIKKKQVEALYPIEIKVIK